MIAAGVGGAVVLALAAWVYLPRDSHEAAPMNSSATTRPAKVERVFDRLRSEDGGSMIGDSPVATTGQTPKIFRKKRDQFVPLGTMRIPAIKLETPIYQGVSDKVVENGPGLWPGTPIPGGPGNSVFAGHRTTHTHPFMDLDHLDEGDRIITSVGANKTTYKVFKASVVAEERYVDVVLRQPRSKSTRMITVFACTPKGFRTHRIVVQARTDSFGTKANT